MRLILDWLRSFRWFRYRPAQSDPTTYHARRFVQEQQLLHRAKCAAAIRAHHCLAAAHREALRRHSEEDDARA